jgi:hypothetical protein
MLKPRPNGRKRRARENPFEKQYNPERPRSKRTTKAAVRAQQLSAITPADLEHALRVCNHHWGDEYMLVPDWNSGADSGGVLACVRRNGKIVGGRLGALRVRLDFREWGENLPALEPHGADRVTVLTKPHLMPYHCIQMESDPGCKPWLKPDIKAVIPVLCSALGLDPVGQPGIRKLKAEGLPDVHTGCAPVGLDGRRLRPSKTRLSRRKPYEIDLPEPTAAPKKFRNPLEPDLPDCVEPAQPRFALPAV